MNPDIISSAQNPLIKLIRSLDKKSQRDEAGLFIVEGEKLVREIPSSWHVDRFVLSESYYTSNPLAYTHKESTVTVITDRLFNSVSTQDSPQGILALCKQKQMGLESIPKTGNFWVYLHRASDPGNLGAILRTALAVGASGVLISEGSADIFGPKVVRSSAGVMLKIPIATGISWSCAKAFFQSANIKTAATCLPGAVDLYQSKIPSSVAFVMGNEGEGLPDEIIKDCDYRVKIPMNDQVESLNLAVAASLMLYEAFRQQKLTL